MKGPGHSGQLARFLSGDLLIVYTEEVGSKSRMEKESVLNRDWPRPDVPFLMLDGCLWVTRLDGAPDALLHLLTSISILDEIVFV